jgi:hypothetical protein
MQQVAAAIGFSAKFSMQSDVACTMHVSNQRPPGILIQFHTWASLYCRAGTNKCNSAGMHPPGSSTVTVRLQRFGGSDLAPRSTSCRYAGIPPDPDFRLLTPSFNFGGGYGGPPLSHAITPVANMRGMCSAVGYPFVALRAPVPPPLKKSRIKRCLIFGAAALRWERLSASCLLQPKCLLAAAAAAASLPAACCHPHLGLPIRLSGH